MKYANYYTCSFEICIGFLNTVQITLSSNGGVVRDPSYLQKSRGAFPSLGGSSLAGSTFSSSEKETLSPLFGMSASLLHILWNSSCLDPTWYFANKKYKVKLLYLLTGYFFVLWILIIEKVKITSRNMPSTANPSGSPAATFGESYLLLFQCTRWSCK